MNRPLPPGRPSSTTRKGYGALAVEDVESSESEPEDIVVPASESLPMILPAPIQRSESRPDTPLIDQARNSAKSAKRAAKKAAAKGLGLPGNSSPDETAPSPGTAPAMALPIMELHSAPGRPSIEVSTSPIIQIETHSGFRARSPSRSPGATSSFHPSLPESLPQPISPGLGPRKRKASQDLKSNPLPKESKLEGHVNGVTTVVTESGAKIGVVELSIAEAVPSEQIKNKQNMITRTIWTFIMIFGFLGLLLAGPVYMILLVMAIQTQVYREVTNLFVLSAKSKSEPRPVEEKGRDPWSKTLNWYFFAVANYFLYGESMIYYFKHVVYADVRFLPFANNHRFISFMLYVFGFMGFVASLKKQFLRQQFGLFGWVHMSLLVIVVSSHFVVNNILEGMIWFWIPASLVICNDIFAYIWGKTFGRTQLIALSPKKTVEGFVGAFISTIIFGLCWGTFFMRFNYMICPAVNLGANAFSNVQCHPNPAFVWRTFTLPPAIQPLVSNIIPIPPINWAPFQIHSLVMATFASLVAPFGGFFASGFKRAFDLKDFGDSIPGHGGLTDRMDCQFLMGMFTYVYYSSIVRVHSVTVGSVMQTIVSGLSVQEQYQLFQDLRYYLEGLGTGSVPS